MKLGVITDGINRRELRPALETARAAGLEFAEFQYFGGKEAGDHSKAERDEARKALDDSGLRASCVSRHLFNKLAVAETSASDAAFRREMDALARCVEFAREAGTRFVRVMSFRRETILFGGGGAEHWVVAGGMWERFVSLMEHPLRLAEREDVVLVVETGNGGMVNSAFQARRLVDDLGGPGGHFAALWDPCNCLYCGEAPFPDGCEALGEEGAGHVHIKDARVFPARSTVDFCRLGTGHMAPHLENIAAKLREWDYAGTISLESTYCPEGRDFGDGFAESVGLFKEVFGGE